MRRHVTRGARVAVVTPGSADVVAALENDVVRDAGLCQFDRRTETGETTADDQCADVASIRGRC